jgi:cytidine deaminase
MSVPDRDSLVAAARAAAGGAYAPYSRFHVGAALAFADGTVLTGSNVENASYGLSLCAETVAAARALNDGRRGGLVAVAVIGGAERTGATGRHRSGDLVRGGRWGARTAPVRPAAARLRAGEPDAAVI